MQPPAASCDGVCGYRLKVAFRELHLSEITVIEISKLALALWE
jgi:hypothetical protein